jgi:aspartyl-tRNA synthetase
MAKNKMSIKEFLSLVDMKEGDILVQVQRQKEISREFVNQKRNDLEADERLLNNQKTNPELIGDTTLFNVHTALMARSFSDKINISSCFTHYM